jgi:nitroreductase
MKTFLELASARRSVRKYSDAPVEREKIELCLEAARLAPSACNAQPWRFVVADEPGFKARLARAAFSGVFSPTAFAARAPVIVVALALPGAFLPRLAGSLQGKQYRLIDLGIACEHFILEAAETGLGTCWIGWFDAGKVKKLLAPAVQGDPVALIAVGYPAESPPAVPRKTRGEIRVFNPPIGK